MDYVTRNWSENNSLRFPDEVLPGAWPPPQHIKCKEPRKLREEAEEREQVRVWQTLKGPKECAARFPAEEGADQSKSEKWRAEGRENKQVYGKDNASLSRH